MAIPPQPLYMAGLELDLDSINSPELRALLVELYSTPLTQLRQRFQSIFKKPTSSNNRRWLLKRLTDYYLATDTAPARQSSPSAFGVATPRPSEPMAPRTLAPTPTPLPATCLGKRVRAAVAAATASPSSSEGSEPPMLKRARAEGLPPIADSDAEGSEVRLSAAALPAALPAAPTPTSWSRPELTALIAAVELCGSADRWPIIAALEIPALRNRSDRELGQCWQLLSLKALAEMTAMGSGSVALACAAAYPKDLVDRVKVVLINMAQAKHVRPRRVCPTLREPII